MTRSRHVTPSRTIERVERLQSLVKALSAGRMLWDDIGAMLNMGPSGVRKYLVDLSGMVETVSEAGERVCCWTASAVETEMFLSRLAAEAAARPPVRQRSALAIAAQDPCRHFHILSDDVEFQVKPQRHIPAPDPVLAHFFNRIPAGVWA